MPCRALDGETGIFIDMSNTDNIKLTILTPEAVLFDGPVNKVDLPGDKGRFMVLKSHAPIISSLSAGAVVYTCSGEVAEVRISGGFVRVADDEVTVCAKV